MFHPCHTTPWIGTQTPPNIGTTTVVALIRTYNESLFIVNFPYTMIKLIISVRSVIKSIRSREG